MQTHIGTKLVKATPMDRGAYNEYRGWSLPKEEDPNDLGFLVEYVDSDTQNHPKHDGYVSWSPAKEFVRAYHNVHEATSFGSAVELLKAGFKVTRKGWNGKGMFLFLVSGSTFEVNRPPLLGIYKEGTKVEYQSHIDMVTADGSVVPWLASQSDILANDWHIID